MLFLGFSFSRWRRRQPAARRRQRRRRVGSQLAAVVQQPEPLLVDVAGVATQQPRSELFRHNPG